MRRFWRKQERRSNIENCKKEKKEVDRALAMNYGCLFIDVLEVEGTS